MSKNIKVFFVWFLATYALAVLMVFCVGTLHVGTQIMLETMLHNSMMMLSFAAPALLAAVLASRNRSVN